MTAPRPLAEVAPGVWTATAEIWTSLTTVVVADDGGCLVVDPGITVAELDGLVAAIESRGWRVVAGFSTHPHWDHVLWHAGLGDVPRWAPAEAMSELVGARARALADADAAAPGHDPALFGALTPLPDGATSVPWDGPTVWVVVHAGHAVGHAALVLPHAGVLVAGDMLSDIEIPLLDVDLPTALVDYRAGLDAIEDAVGRAGVRVVVPGHGHVGDAAELARRFAADRAYLGALEVVDEVTAGRDPRITGAWLEREHAKNAAWARHRARG